MKKARKIEGQLNVRVRGIEKRVAELNQNEALLIRVNFITNTCITLVHYGAEDFPFLMVGGGGRREVGDGRRTGDGNDCGGK